MSSIVNCCLHLSFIEAGVVLAPILSVERVHHMWFVIASRARAVNLGARLQFQDSRISTCFTCVRTICGVVWVVDAVFPRLFVCVFVVLLWCCVWFVLFCSVVLIGLGLFWGLARVVWFCCVGVAVCFVCLLVCSLVGRSIGWLVVLWCFICVCVVLLCSLLVDAVGHVITCCSSAWVWCCLVWFRCVLWKQMVWGKMPLSQSVWENGDDSPRNHLGPLCSLTADTGCSTSR